VLGLIFRFEDADLNGPICVNHLDELIPLVGGAFLILSIRLRDKFSAAICRGKEWPQVVLESLLVTLGKGFSK